MKDLNFISPFKKLCITIGNLPTAYIESMSYYEGLTFLVNYLANNVIPAVNNNSEVVKELQDQFVILKNYVDNYFNNLDVQEEINTKLDEMADSGQLTDIIAQYLGLAGMIAFDNLADMKAAQNLVNGSKCRTLGYYNVNDGGGAYYKIRTVTNDDVVDDMFIIEVYDDTLVGELIFDNELNIKQIGGHGNNTDDDTNIIKAALNKCNNIYLPEGTYLLSDGLDIEDKNIRGDNYKTTILNEHSITSPREHYIIFSGSNNIKDLTIDKTFTYSGDYGFGKNCGLYECNNSTFENVYFISDGYSTGSTLDLYTDNHNVIFKDCYSYLNSVNGSNVNEVGGLWIREHEAAKTTSNITFENCKIVGKSKDEVIAVWNWFGKVKNIFFNNCYINSPSDNSAPHFITVGGDNIQFNNCSLINETIQSVGQTNKIGSIIHADSSFASGEDVILNSCIIRFNAELMNAITTNDYSGNIYVNNSEITNTNYLAATGKGIYNGCNITSGIITIRYTKAYNCNFNYLNNTGNYKIAQGGFTVVNCEFNNLYCNNTTLIQIFTSTENIYIKDCNFSGSTFSPAWFILNSGTIPSLMIINSSFASKVDYGNVTKGLVNNCVSTTSFSSAGNLVVNNLVVY